MVRKCCDTLVEVEIVSIKHVILGLLSEMPLTGYDLKKKFSSSTIFPWSGNNNQIYKSLVELHEENLVTVEVHYQESKPPRKLYTITDEGRAALQQWLRSTPELPQLQNGLLVQLTWADQLETEALKTLLANYEEELQVYVAMLREQARRDNSAASTEPPTFSLTARAAEHWISFYQLELDWVHSLRQEIHER